jgi:glutathione S-transferase
MIVYNESVARFAGSSISSVATMKLELVSHALCPFVHRAAIMLREKGVPFDRRIVDLKSKPDWFLAISPRGKVPVLVADGTALFESAAICEFLDETIPPRLIPAEPFERARQRAWVEVANDLLAAQFKAFVAADPVEAEKTRAAVDAVLVRFEEAITSGVISETAFGLIQVAVAPALHRFVVAADRLGADLLARTPRLSALSRNLAGRPSVAETVPEDFGSQFVQILAERGSQLVAGAVSVRSASTG